jgi:NAD(P)H-dependent FMN reductase/ketosteroid isomerase-like protein
VSAVEILLVSGSLRGGSVNTAVLRTAAAIATEPVHAELYEGLGELPHFNPDSDLEGAPPPPAVADLRAHLARADAILYCTPEYAGALPGAFKNLLDWTVGGGEAYSKPAAWINVTSRPDDAEVRGAYESLRTVLGYTGAEIVEEACRRIRVARAAIGADGLVAAAGVREQIGGVLEALAARVLGGREGSDSSAAAQEALLACDRAFFRALVARDVPALEELLANDFLIVDVGSGGVHARAELLDAVREGAVVFDSIEEHPDDALTRREGDVAITVGRTSMSMTAADGPPAQIDSRYTHVFRASDGRWQLISAQGTPIRV